MRALAPDAGGRDDDRQHGGSGNDRIFANRGVDVTFGEAGNDDLAKKPRARTS